MTDSQERPNPQPATNDCVEEGKEADLMKKYDIVRERMDYYHLGPFRYTSLKDAIAQAKRQATMGSV